MTHLFKKRCPSHHISEMKHTTEVESAPSEKKKLFALSWTFNPTMSTSHSRNIPFQLIKDNLGSSYYKAVINPSKGVLFVFEKLSDFLHRLRLNG